MKVITNVITWTSIAIIFYVALLALSEYADHRLNESAGQSQSAFIGAFPDLNGAGWQSLLEESSYGC